MPWALTVRNNCAHGGAVRYRAWNISGLLPLCFRIESVSRHQSIRAHAVDCPGRSFQRAHRLNCPNARWLSLVWDRIRPGSFDDVRGVPRQPPADERLPNSSVYSLLAARDGRLWIGTRAGLASWKDGKLTHYAELAGQAVVTILEAVRTAGTPSSRSRPVRQRRGGRPG
jgi:hypothetical protein